MQMPVFSRLSAYAVTMGAVLAGAGTALTIRSVWAPHSFWAWLRGRWFGKRDVEQHLARIMDNVLHALFRERPSF